MYYITINVQYVRYSTGRKIKYFIVYRYLLSLSLFFDSLLIPTPLLLSLSLFFDYFLFPTPLLLSISLFFNSFLFPTPLLTSFVVF